MLYKQNRRQNISDSEFPVWAHHWQHFEYHLVIKNCRFSNQCFLLTRKRKAKIVMKMIIKKWTSTFMDSHLYFFLKATKFGIPNNGPWDDQCWDKLFWIFKTEVSVLGDKLSNKKNKKDFYRVMMYCRAYKKTRLFHF